MTTKDIAKKNFERGLWSVEMLVKLVNKGKLTSTEYEEIVGSAYIEAPLTEEQIQAHLTQVVQNYMDKTVQTRGYDNIHTACTYANSTDETFKAEGTACVVWRDAVWRKCYDILAEVKAGTREIPTEEELLAELPALNWSLII